MTAKIIVLADRRPSGDDWSELARLRAYAQRYMRHGGLKIFSDDNLDDLERLIVKHSVVVEYIDEGGNTAERQIIFVE